MCILEEYVTLKPKLTEILNEEELFFVKATFYVMFCFQHAHLAVNQFSLKICINPTVFSVVQLLLKLKV